VRDEIEKFKRAGLQPFGVNPAGVDSHWQYAEKMLFGFPLLSDPDRSIARAYRALKEDGRGIIRTVYVVTRDGKVAFARRGAPPVDEIVAAVRGGNGESGGGRGG
jgi:thioredoxin-dependent peroxiredoxin